MAPSDPVKTNTHSPFPSVFDREFDIVVCGAGFVGFSAAHAFAQRGLAALLLDSSGDLLWEASRALENIANEPRQTCPEWTAWLGTLRTRGGADERFFEPALAEILAARELSTSPGYAPSILLYAVPVSLERSGARIASLTVATKGGPRRVRARYWFDATERGCLARLADPTLAPRAPAHLERNFILHTAEPGALDAALEHSSRQRGDFVWSGSLRPEERRLRLAAGAAHPAWHRRVPQIVSELRALAGPQVPFVLSLCATCEFPVYDDTQVRDFAGLPENLFVSSPALRGEALVSPADRFAFGVRLAKAAAARISAPTAATRPAAPARALALPEPLRSLPASEVLVAGAGTGGAAAAISAGRAGARVRAIDFITWPGGVGTASGICGYFHGAKGGLHLEIDERTRLLTALFTGGTAVPHVWHHEAKRITLLELFDEAGVEFIGEAFLAGVERDDHGRVGAALAVIDGALVRLPAASFIDGTGDGDLAVFAGASFVAGRPGDSRTLSYSQSIFSLCTKDGRPQVRSCNFDAGWVDPTDAEDLTRARLLGIAQHYQTPWTQPERAIALAPWIGLRQSRQIDTDYAVTMPDLVGGARFEDSIGETETMADTHSVDFEFEKDETAFYYWTCRAFRNPLRCELPYRMLLPRGLDNVWLACRAAGIEVDAAYGLRMQRDVQRFGEAAGLAAAQAVSRGAGARAIDLAAVQAALVASGAKPAGAKVTPPPEAAALLATLDGGLPGMHLWHIFRDRDRHEAAVRERLRSPSERVSFYAAALLALWADDSAEPRLISALEGREIGPVPEEKLVHGAFGQCIDIPFWVQAVLLLRRVGSARCLPALRVVAGQIDLPLNVRTTLALTLERLASRAEAHEDLLRALDSLTASAPPDPVLPPSRSLWRTLQGQPQKKLANDHGAPVAQDHTWQLHLTIARARRALGQPPSPAALAFARDPRAFVRTTFEAALAPS